MHIGHLLELRGCNFWMFDLAVVIFQANTKRILPISGLLKELLAKYPNINQLAQRAFVTYLRSIHIQKDKEIFDVTKLSIDEYSMSLGLPVPPKVRFLKNKLKSKTPELCAPHEPESSVENEVLDISREKLDTGDSDEDEKNLLLTEDTQDGEKKEDELGDIVYVAFLEVLLCLIGRFKVSLDSLISDSAS